MVRTSAMLHGCGLYRTSFCTLETKNIFLFYCLHFLDAKNLDRLLSVFSGSMQSDKITTYI